MTCANDCAVHSGSFRKFLRNRKRGQHNHSHPNTGFTFTKHDFDSRKKSYILITGKLLQS